MALPSPSEAAKKHSQKLQTYLEEKIHAKGKLSFYEYMQLVLYAPGLGYYSAGAHKLGEAGDFITAPELSPAFGACLAKSLLPFQAKEYLELGAGTGKLAESFLDFLHKKNSLPENYFILEVSPDLQERQKNYLKKTLAPEVFERIHWLHQLPEKISGVIFANEVLDALAVHRFKITENGPEEFFIDTKGEFLEAPSSTLLKERIEALELPEGYESEINLQQEALLKSLSERLTEGGILFIDYGFPAHEYYHASRKMGTLMCHYRHHAHTDPYFLPGLQDITAHVDFTALAKCGIENGLQLLAYTTQEAWLSENGFLELSPESKAAKKILSPAEMGELFKVILFGKNLKKDFSFELKHDRRHSLG